MNSPSWNEPQNRRSPSAFWGSTAPPPTPRSPRPASRPVRPETAVDKLSRSCYSEVSTEPTQVLPQAGKPPPEQRDQWEPRQKQSGKEPTATWGTLWWQQGLVERAQALQSQVCLKLCFSPHCVSFRLSDHSMGREDRFAFLPRGKWV